MSWRCEASTSFATMCGGVGPSGMGSYHGHQGFLTFSKAMPVLYQARFSSMRFMRPPYNKLADFLVRFLKIGRAHV